MGLEGRDPTVELQGDRAALGTGTARSPGQQGRSGGQHAQGCSEETRPRHGRGVALLEAGRWALCQVTASCTSCWSFYSGPPSGWGSCFPPWILRSLPWWRLGLYLQWTCRHTARGTHVSQGAESSDGVSGRCHRALGGRAEYEGPGCTYQGVGTAHGGHPALRRPGHPRGRMCDGRRGGKKSQRRSLTHARKEEPSHTPHFQLQKLGSQMKNQKPHGQGPTSWLRA